MSSNFEYMVKYQNQLGPLGEAEFAILYNVRNRNTFMMVTSKVTRAMRGKQK